MGKLQRMRSLLTVPHPERTGGKQVFFGQLLVETTQHVVGVGKETANAVII